MSIVKQISRLAQHSAIYAISTALQKLSGFILIPFYTDATYISSRSEFGDYVSIFTFIAFMHYFYAYGMDSALLRYFFLGDRDRKTVFSSTFYVLVLTSLFSTLLLLLFSKPLATALLGNGSYQPFVQLAAAILFFDVLGNLPYLILRAEEKSIQYTLFRVLRFSLELGFNLFFIVYLRSGVIGILYTSLIAAIVNLLFMLPILLRYLVRRFDVPLAREMLGFALPFLPNGIAFTMVEMIDRFIIPAVLDKDALGLYGANYKFGTILLLVVIAFRNAWQPFFLKVARQENAREIYTRVLSYFVLGGGLIVLAGTYFLRDVLTFPIGGGSFLGEKYWAAIGIIPLILLSYFFFGIYVILTPAFYIEKKSKYMVLFTGSGAIVNVLTNLFLLPRIGIWGAAWATLISYMVMALGIFLVAQRIYPIRMEWGRILKSLSLLLGGMGLYYLVPMGFPARLGVVFLLLFLAWLGILQQSERQSILAKLLRHRTDSNR